MATPAAQKGSDAKQVDGDPLESKIVVNDTNLSINRSLKKDSSLNHVTIRDGVKVYRFTDKRGPLQRIEADRLLNNHHKALGEIKEQRAAAHNKQFKWQDESKHRHI